MDRVLTIFVGLIIGLFVMAAITGGLFFACSAHGAIVQRGRSRLSWIAVYIGIAIVLAVTVGCPFSAPIAKIVVGLMALLQLGVPSTMGFLYGAAKADDEEIAAREHRTMELLMDWEREHLMNAGEYED